MHGQLTSALPQEDESQKIGRMATKCFHANIPVAWKEQALDGDDDCGYDYQVQTVDGCEVKDIFRVQLKGKTKPKLNAGKTHYSVELDMSTVNYYARATEPILLVMCDLSVDPKPKNCHLYYQWIHEDLERIRAREISAIQKAVTFHIPVENRLDDETDLSADIQHFRNLARIGEQLNIAVGKNKPGLSPQRFDDALTEAERSDGLDRLTALAILFSMQARWTDTLAVCTEALAISPQRESTKQLFFILKARAKFTTAIGPVAADSTDERMPLSGPAGANPTAVREAWNDISTAVTALRSAGWPSNVEMIADIWGASASMLGLQQSTLPVFADAAKARPTLQMLQSALESLAVQSANYKLALEANERLTLDVNAPLRRVVLLHHATRHKDCVGLFESLKDFDSVDKTILGYAYSMAILSADRIVRQDLAETWIAAMSSRDDLAAPYALLQYFRTLDQQLLAKDAALVELEAKWEGLGHPVLLTKHLFHEMDVTQAEQAQSCIRLSEILKSEQLLDIDDYLRLSQALTTLGKWNELLDLTNQALDQFENSDRLLAIGALALDKLGRTAEAHQRLKELISKPDPDHVALNTYINIASVSGFSEDAIHCLESVIEHTTDKKEKVSCLRHLFGLIHLSEPTNPRLVEVAWRMGQLADPTDEGQEGLYLMSMFAATLPVSMPFKDEWKAEFQQRLEEFFKRFPNSKILRRALLPEDPSPHEILRILKDIAGLDEEKIQWRTKIQNQLQQGLLPIPFAWRPRYVLDAIPDLPTLWEAAKSSRWSDRQLHLGMTLDEWEPVTLELMRDQVPILDLSALLVIHDLDLFDTLFRIFPDIEKTHC